jgi:hypothetical protein
LVHFIATTNGPYKNRNRVPDVHHERLTQQSHVVNLTSKLTSGAEVTF